MDESISVRVIAELLPEYYSKSALLLRSTVWPGWGQTKIKNGKPYWLIGIASTACAAGAIIYNQQSINSYDDYKNEQDILEGEKLYDLAIQQGNTSNILLYSALGIWAANITLTIHRNLLG